MLNAYFDTGVYDHIVKGWIPSNDVDALRGAMVRGKIRAHLSLADVEELLGQWETEQAVAIKKLQVARDLVGFSGFLKQPTDLIKEAIQAYAVGASPPSPILPPEQQKIVSDCLHRVACDDTSLDRTVSQIVEDVRMLKEEFLHNMLEARTKALAEWGLIPADKRQNLKFREFWEAGATQWAEDFARPLGLVDACRERGSDGLLNIRTVRILVGATMSWVFSLIVGEGDQSRQPRPSDGYDLWHAILASFADVFVTRDNRLAGLLGRVPVDGFRVVTSLPALLCRLS